MREVHVFLEKRGAGESGARRKREQAPALHKPVAAHRPSPRLRPRPTVLRIKHALDSRTPATNRLLIGFGWGAIQVHETESHPPVFRDWLRGPGMVIYAAMFQEYIELETYGEF